MNKQNTRLWASFKTHTVRETPFHPAVCAVWLEVCKQGLIG